MVSFNTKLTMASIALKLSSDNSNSEFNEKLKRKKLQMNRL